MRNRILAIILVILMIPTTLFFYKNQGVVMSNILAKMGETIRFEESSGDVDISVFGRKYIDSKNFESALKRATAQGGATAVVELTEKLPQGNYYIYLKGDTELDGGILTITLYDSEKPASYTSARVLSDEVMESYFVIPTSTDCDFVKLYWSNLNKESIVTIKDLQIVRLNDGTNLNTLELGQYHVDAEVEYVELTKENLIVEDNVIDVVGDGKQIFYTNGNSIFKLDSEFIKICDLSGSAVKIQLLDNNDIVVAMGNDGMSIVHPNGDVEYYPPDLFSDKVIDVAVYGNYYFVCEEYGGIEVYYKDSKNADSEYKYITTVFDNNGIRYLGCAVYNQTLYANTYDRVYCYSLRDINNIARLTTLSARGGIADMFIAGNKLYLATVNSDVDLPRSNKTQSGMGVGTGYTVFDISNESKPVLCDVWRINGRYNSSGYDADLAVYTDSVCLSLMDEGVDLVPIKNNETDSWTNIRVLDDRTKSTYSSGVNIYPEGNEDLKYLPVTKTISTSDGLILCCKGKGLYLYENALEKKISVAKKGTKIDSGTKEEISIYDAVVEDFNVTTITSNTEIFKQVKLFDDYLLASSKDELFLYKKQGETFNDVEISKIKTVTEITEIYCYEDVVFTVQSSKLVCYKIDANEQLVKTYEYLFAGEQVNSITHCNNPIGDMFAVMTNKGVKFVEFDGESYAVKDAYTGASILKFVDQTDKGIIFADINSNYYYHAFADEAKGLKGLSFVADAEDSLDKYKDGWKRICDAGFCLTAHEPTYENGKNVMRFYPKAFTSMSRSLINWSSFSGNQPYAASGDISMYTMKPYGMCFLVNEDDNEHPALYGRILFRGRLWDCDALDGTFAVVSGHEGVTIFSVKDGK